MLTEVFETVSEIVQGVVSVFESLFSGIGTIFYDPTPETGGLTIIGILALLGFGVALAKWGFHLILRLLRMGK